MTRLVATLPPDTSGQSALDFAQRAKELGAGLLEVRTDLTPLTEDLEPLAKVLPLLVSERGKSVPVAWAHLAELLDRDILASSPEEASLCSLHAASPLEPAQAEEMWMAARIAPTQRVKHVEPLGSFAQAHRLFETQARLQERFGNRVTVLAMGNGALPFRALLSEKNQLEYCAVDPSFAAASGQRLLADAVRSQRPDPASAAPRSRLGILGSKIGGSRSPRIHQQPFDRIDLPEETELGGLLEALRPHYRGLAVTSPFKRQVASLTGARISAVNTLVRTRTGWRALNTDVMGAGRALDRLLGGKRLPITILGDGGVTDALKVAARERGLPFTVLRRQEIAPSPLTGWVVWTWPPEVEPPPALRFEEAAVAVVSYGAAGRKIAQRISGLGGTPHLLGAAWFIAQARFQRALWETAE